MIQTALGHVDLLNSTTDELQILALRTAINIKKVFKKDSVKQKMPEIETETEIEDWGEDTGWQESDGHDSLCGDEETTCKHVPFFLVMLLCNYFLSL